MVLRLVGRVSANPAMAGGLTAMLLTAAAIVSNAVFLQQSTHPAPLFSTRLPAAVEDPAPLPTPAPLRPSEVPIPRSRASAAAAERKAQPAIRPTPIKTISATPTPQEDGAALILALQRRLAERGLYDGRIDGISGSRTQAAIAAYEKAAGLTVTGAPSRATLDHIEAAKDRMPATEQETAVAEGDGSADADEGAAHVTQRGAMAFAPASEPADAVESASPEERSRYRAVQHALNQIGYGPIDEDGGADPETEEAIRRFERDNGLPATGQANQALVDRLVAIGALEAS